MPLMLSKTYDALKAAGAPDEKRGKPPRNWRAMKTG
jgi:hypothetical protein